MFFLFMRLFAQEDENKCSNKKISLLHISIIFYILTAYSYILSQTILLPRSEISFSYFALFFHRKMKFSQQNILVSWRIKFSATNCLFYFFFFCSFIVFAGLWNEMNVRNIYLPQKAKRKEKKSHLEAATSFGTPFGFSSLYNGKHFRIIIDLHIWL